MTEYRFDQLVEISQVRNLLESHHSLSGMAYGLFDANENNLIAVGWQEICVRFHRINPFTCARCRESDAFIKAHLHSFEGDYLEYRCKNGMIDVAMPIVIDGEHLATFFTGQFFYDDDRPDLEFFLMQAEALGFDLEAYLKALERVPVLSREHVRSNMLFLSNMVKVLVRCGLNNLRLTREVDNRKQVEGLLLKLLQDFRTLTDNTPDTIARYDQECRRLYANRALADLAGVPVEELLGKTPTSYSSSPGSIEYETVIRSVFQNGQAEEYEYTWPDRDGRLITSLIRIVPECYQDGQITSVLCVGRDITERKRMEDDLLKAKSLESLGALARGIAHDFNNILTAIIGHITIAQMHLDIPDKAIYSLEIAQKASKRASGLARRLTTFAKGGEPIKTCISLQHLLEEAMALALQENNIHGDVNVQDSLHNIEADEIQISQVFNNIITNAAQAMPRGGKLTVSAGNTDASECGGLGLAAGTYVKIAFTDEGCGISEEEQQRIFDPFFTTKPGGTGIGLASCHSIITRHGGRIVVSSTVGAGTTFTVYLPSLGHPLQEVAGEPARQGGRTGATILVMDDERTIRETLTTLLRHIGCQATVCSDGQEAISLYRLAREAGTPFDAVIMDLNVPNGMGGKEAARHILGYDPAAHLIVSSGYSEDPVMANHGKYGFRGVLPKPYTIEQVARLLKT